MLIIQYIELSEVLKVSLKMLYFKKIANTYIFQQTVPIYSIEEALWSAY
jgi:hypothetical protein